MRDGALSNTYIYGLGCFHKVPRFLQRQLSKAGSRLIHQHQRLQPEFVEVYQSYLSWSERRVEISCLQGQISVELQVEIAVLSRDERAQLPVERVVAQQGLAVCDRLFLVFSGNERNLSLQHIVVVFCAQVAALPAAGRPAEYGLFVRK